MTSLASVTVAGEAVSAEDGLLGYAVFMMWNVQIAVAGGRQGDAYVRVRCRQARCLPLSGDINPQPGGRFSQNPFTLTGVSVAVKTVFHRIPG